MIWWIDKGQLHMSANYNFNIAKLTNPSYDLIATTNKHHPWPESIHFTYLYHNTAVRLRSWKGRFEKTFLHDIYSDKFHSNNQNQMLESLEHKQAA